ncbi:MAG: patatin-like phospholipase family protein [Nitrospira sp.]|nr:patatin-like phospholipase family protein [Nitrospira sp.]
MKTVHTLAIMLARAFGAWLSLACAMLLLGCEYVRPTMNAPLAHWDPAYGYRSTNLPPSKTGSSDSLFIVASFSGGGARASALSYGVLQELARTPITWEGRQKRLVDELNIINAVSGGFTAVYYALYGNRIFRDFETFTSPKDWESELRSRIFRSPSNRFDSGLVFRSGAYSLSCWTKPCSTAIPSAIPNRRQRPIINLHASDMASSRASSSTNGNSTFVRTQPTPLVGRYRLHDTALVEPYFDDELCRPMRISTSGSLIMEERPTAWGRQRARELRSYLDTKQRPYIHLLDGGLSDNIGMRSVLETTALFGDLESTFQMLGAKNIRKLVYVMVSAETAPDITQYQLNDIPGLMRVSRALIDIPINRYSTDTLQLMNHAIQQWRLQLRQRPDNLPSIFAPDADIYFINASLTEITDPEEEARLMNIATNLALTNEEVDHLLQAGSRLLQDNPEFQRLIRDLALDAATTSSAP